MTESLDRRRCGFCRRDIPTTDPRRVWCSKKCRQTAFRLRKRAGVVEQASRPLTFVYADPPYVGLSRKYYATEPDFAGEVDHEALIVDLRARARSETFGGWALSCSSASLRTLLPLCPPEVRPCVWAKPGPAPKRSHGIHTLTESVLVYGGRQEPPGVPDWLYAQPARGDPTNARRGLMGRKPLAFCAWLFQLLGMRRGDTLIDLFPGTGVVSAAWEHISKVRERGRG